VTDWVIVIISSSKNILRCTASHKLKCVCRRLMLLANVCLNVVIATLRHPVMKEPWH